MTDRAKFSRLLAVFNELSPGYKDLVLSVVQGIQLLRQTDGTFWPDDAGRDSAHIIHSSLSRSERPDDAGRDSAHIIHSSLSRSERPDNLFGMNSASAKEYVIGHITSLKLMEKKYEDLSREYEKWSARVELARSRNNEELAQEAAAETEKVRERRDSLGAEVADLKAQIEHMRTQLPGVAARERSIDPDLLEQELLIALGYTPGDETGTEHAAQKRRFEELDADAALEALKAKLRNR
jgi:hypothetical protein